MEHDHDFSALRNVLALRKLEVPIDTEVNRFLIEFHRRQRAQLLVPDTTWDRAVAWLKARADGFRLVPSLSYASSFAAVALLAVLGFSPEVQVAQNDGSYKLSLRLPSSESSFALMPASFVRDAAAPSSKSDALTFTPASSGQSATRFVLSSNRVAYDATAAF